MRDICSKKKLLSYRCRGRFVSCLTRNKLYKNSYPMRMYGRTSKRIIVKANDKSAKVVIMLVKEYYLWIVIHAMLFLVLGNCIFKFYWGHINDVNNILSDVKIFQHIWHTTIVNYKDISKSSEGIIVLIKWWKSNQ